MLCLPHNATSLYSPFYESCTPTTHFPFVQGYRINRKDRINLLFRKQLLAANQDRVLAIDPFVWIVRAPVGRRRDRATVSGRTKYLLGNVFLRFIAYQIEQVTKKRRKSTRWVPAAEDAAVIQMKGTKLPSKKLLKGIEQRFLRWN